MVYDVIRTAVVVPVQEMKRITHEHSVAKNIKLGSSEVQQVSRSNPDSSSGLYVTSELRAKARAVQDAKAKKKELDRFRKVENDSKQREIARKKVDAFNRLQKTIKQFPLLEEGLNKHVPATDLKLAYQHLGGKIGNLPNGKKETYVSLLKINEIMIAATSVAPTNI